MDVPAWLVMGDVDHHEAGNDEEQVHAGEAERPLACRQGLGEKALADLCGMTCQTSRAAIARRDCMEWSGMMAECIRGPWLA